MTGKQLALGQAMVTWLNALPAVAAVGTVTLEASGAPHPRYPVDPVADCPLLLLVPNVGQNQLAVTQGRRSTYQFSLWYYLRQTSGQAHRTLLGEDLRDLEAAYLTDARPTALQNQTLNLQIPYEVRWHDDMRHPLADEPRLRVSVGEILIVVNSDA